MQKALRNLSQEELIYKIFELEFQLAQYKRIVHGQKRERFEGNKNQMSLPFEAAQEQDQKQEVEVKEKLSCESRKRRCAHQGRIPLPDHLAVEEIEIYLEEDITDMVCIGKEITEELEYEPAKYYIKRYIRYKYAPKNKEGVFIGELPNRVIEKGIPGAGLLASSLIDKYMDNLPLYRQLKRLKRETIPISSSNLEG